MKRPTTFDMLLDSIRNYEEENGEKPDSIIVFGDVENFIDIASEQDLPQEIISDDKDRPKEIFDIQIEYKDYKLFDECMIRLI